MKVRKAKNLLLVGFAALSQLAATSVALADERAIDENLSVLISDIHIQTRTRTANAWCSPTSARCSAQGFSKPLVPFLRPLTARGAYAILIAFSKRVFSKRVFL